MSEVCNATVLATVLEVMPPFPEKQSPLLVRLKQKKPLMEAETTANESTTHTEDGPKLTETVVMKIRLRKNIFLFLLLQIHLNQQPQQQENGILVALDLIDSNGHDEPTTSNVKNTLNVNLSTKKLLLKNSDIIFENDLIQVGIKVEPMKSILRVEFYYGNKTNANLSNLCMAINLSPELESGKIFIDFSTFPLRIKPG